MLEWGQGVDLCPWRRFWPCIKNFGMTPKCTLWLQAETFLMCWSYMWSKRMHQENALWSKTPQFWQPGLVLVEVIDFTLNVTVRECALAEWLAIKECCSECAAFTCLCRSSHVEQQYNSAGEEINGMKMKSKGAGSVLDWDGSVDACFVADTIGGPSHSQKEYMLSLTIGVGDGGRICARHLLLYAWFGQTSKGMDCLLPHWKAGNCLQFHEYCSRDTNLCLRGTLAYALMSVRQEPKFISEIRWLRNYSKKWKLL